MENSPAITDDSNNPLWLHYSAFEWRSWQVFLHEGRSAKFCYFAPTARDVARWMRLNGCYHAAHDERKVVIELVAPSGEAIFFGGGGDLDDWIDEHHNSLTDKLMVKMELLLRSLRLRFGRKYLP